MSRPTDVRSGSDRWVLLALVVATMGFADVAELLALLGEQLLHDGESAAAAAGGVPGIVRWIRGRASVREIAESGLVEPSVDHQPGCFAPSMQLYFSTNGDVGSCSWSGVPYGNVTRDRVTDIWVGEVRRRRVSGHAVGDYSGGCDGCGAAVRLEGRAGSHPAYFDQWERRLAEQMPGVDVTAMPRRLEFDLSNACNLQCAHCSGDFSSSIREHREKRPPMPRVYDDRFFEDLEVFLPGLAEVSFSGGEPFLAVENTRVWESMARLAPHVPIRVATNGTIWDEQVAWVLSTFRTDVVLSIDTLNPDVFESFRAGSSFEAVMGNLELLRETANSNGGSLTVNACLTPGTAPGLADLLQFAEHRSIPVNVRPVRNPSSCAVPALPLAELDALIVEMERSDGAVSGLALNGPMWRRTMEWMRTWREAQARSGRTSYEIETPTMLMFQRAGAGPHDDTAARAELAARSPGGVVLWAVVGDNDQFVAVDPDLAAEVDRAPEDLVGRHPSVLLDAITSYDEIARTPDRVDVVCGFPRGEVRGSIVANRDDTGRCATVSMLFTVPTGAR